MGLYVVGMHRSGTSATTEALATLPFEMPEDVDLVGGNESNPHGHFEVQALMDLNETLLTRVGGSWYAPTSKAIDAIAELADPAYGIEPQARRSFRHAYRTDEWLMKDPRLCLTLPFWRTVIPGQHAAILVRRDPVAIAHSIRDRNGLALRHGLAVWERYLRAALTGLEGMQVHVVDYTSVLAGEDDARALVEFAADHLGPAGDGVTLDERFERFRAVIDPGLRHHRTGSDSVFDELLTPEQRQLAELCSSLDGRHEAFVGPDLGDETPGLDLLFESAVTLVDLDRSTFEEGRRAISDEFYIESRIDDARVAEAEKQLELARMDFDDAERDHLAEIDRLRTMLTEADLEHARDGLMVHRIDELEAELATIVHERNLASLELDALHRRRVVRMALGFADRLHQVAEARHSKPEPTPVAPAEPRLPDWDLLAQRIADGELERKLTVIVPIHNAVQAVQRCLEALDRFTPDEVDIVLVDDCSTDDRMDLVLNQFAGRPGLTLVRNEVNLGFPGTVNRGLAEVGEGDVVILNSDTMVTPRWTWRLRLAANERPDIATVTPLSDHAGVFSFEGPPVTGIDHGAQIAASVARTSGYVRPVGPTGNGFCLYVRREALDHVDGFDADAFPRGYGEENDFCMKLGAAGFEHVIADDTVVFHEESASFGDHQREALIADGLRVLNERYPGYDELARGFVDSPAFVAARATAGVGAATAEGARPRVLHVMHEGGGGTEFFARDLAEFTNPAVESLLLMPDGDTLRLWRDEGHQWVIEREWQLAEGWDIRRFRDPAAARIALEVLTRFDISIVHIQHLLGLTFDLPELAESLAIPVVMSLHDFYLVCPSVNLLDNQLRYCGGTCTEGPGQCPTPMFLPDDLPLKHRFVNLWRHETSELFGHIPAFVAPSDDTRDRFLTSFGAEVAPRIRVIEHGRDFGRQRAHARYPDPESPMSLLLVGGINRSKGATVVEELARVGPPQGVNIEILGKVEPGFEEVAHQHGEYTRDELLDLLAVIRPTFIGVFSLWPETHCYVVSEAWAAGIPVITGPLGAPAERVLTHGGGIVVDELDPDVIVAAARRYGRDRRAYEQLVRSASLANVRTAGDMTGDWLDLYNELAGDVRGWVR